MRETELKISRVITTSLLFSLLIPSLIAIASLLNPKENSISQAFLGYVIFFAPFSIIISVVMTIVSATVFILVLKRRKISTSVIYSSAAVSIAGLIAAALVGQFQELDILSFVIAGTCIGALIGPIGASVSKEYNLV